MVSMKNSVIYYVVIAVGVIALLVGLYYMFIVPPPLHTVRAYGGIGGGIILLIIGIAGMVIARPKASAK